MKALLAVLVAVAAVVVLLAPPRPDAERTGGVWSQARSIVSNVLAALRPDPHRPLTVAPDRAEVEASTDQKRPEASTRKGPQEAHSAPAGSRSLPAARAVLAPEPAASQARSASGAATAALQDDDSTRDAPAADDQLAIGGLVLFDSGFPAPAVEVELRARHLFERVEDERALDTVTVSTHDGYYEFQDLVDGEYFVHVPELPGYAPARASVRAGERAVDLVLHQTRAVRVSGVVRDEEGRPLAGVLVRSAKGAEPASTDLIGHYEFTLSMAKSGESVPVRFELPGFHEHTLRVRPRDWETQGWVVLDATLERMDALAQVRGRVRAADGASAPGEVVELHSQRRGERYRAVTDSTGRFALDDVALASDYRLTIRSDGRYRDHVLQPLVVDERGLRLDIELEPLAYATVYGRMVDAQRNPIPGFSLWLRSRDAVLEGRLVTGDGGGRFVAGRVPAGELVFETRTTPSLSVLGIVAHPGRQPREVELILDYGTHELAGQVLDTDGLPVALAEVWLAWERRSDGTRSRSRRRALTDADGFFVFTGLGPGLHALSVQAPGFLPFERAYRVGRESDEALVELVPSRF